MLDPYSGKIVSTDYLPGHQPRANATVTSFFTLHFGSFGGTPVTWMHFLLGLAGAFLFYSGNLLWIESRRKRRGAPQTNSARWMSALTVGVSLGCVIGLSLTIAAAKWLHGVADLPFWHKAVYYGAFFGATGWACLRGAGRAAPALLGAAAIATVVIPLTSLVAVVFPDSGGWAHASAPALGVDVTALAGAAAFAWMARVSARRARAGVPGSVWAANSGGEAVRGVPQR